MLMQFFLPYMYTRLTTLKEKGRNGLCSCKGRFSLLYPRTTKINCSMPNVFCGENQRQPSFEALRMDVTVPVYRQLCFPQISVGVMLIIRLQTCTHTRTQTRTHTPTCLWLDPITESPRGKLLDKSVARKATPSRLPSLLWKSPWGLCVCVHVCLHMCVSVCLLFCTCHRFLGGRWSQWCVSGRLISPTASLAPI